MKSRELNKRQRMTLALVVSLLLFAVALPLFINGTGMESQVRHYVSLPPFIKHADPASHAWWLSALIAAGVIGALLLFMLVRGILGLGKTNAAIIFATVGIMSGAVLVKPQPHQVVTFSGPRCIVIGGGGGGHGGGSAAPAAAAPAAAAPSGGGFGGV